MKKMNNVNLPVLAVDIGGTKIIAALINSDGNIETRVRTQTGAANGKDASLNNLFLAIDNVLNQSGHNLDEIHSISIAAAGAIDMAKGVVTASPNLTGWFNVPLLALVRERYQVDSYLLNDAKAAAVAEHDFGAGKGVKNMIFLTISTGIGGGIIIDDKLYFGKSGVAGELGHMTVEASGPRCLCGNTGCMEIMASGRAIALDARSRIQKGASSILLELAGGNIDCITAETVADAARRGDTVSLAIIERAAFYLGVGMANIANIFNPGMIVSGGGVSKMGDLLLEPVRRVVRERAFRLAADDAVIVQAKFGDDSGVLGAASYAYRQSGR